MILQFQADLALLEPEIAASLLRLAADSVVQQSSAAAGILLTVRPELNRNPGGPLRQIFIARDGGMRMLQHLPAYFAGQFQVVPRDRLAMAEARRRVVLPHEPPRTAESAR